VARLGLDQDRVGEKRGPGGDVCELAGKLAVDKMKGLVANQPGGRGVPERSGASVSEGDLVAVGKGEQIPEAATHTTNKILDRLLAMGCSHQVGPFGKRTKGLWPHLRRPTAEAPVEGLEVIRDLGFVSHLGNRRLLGRSRGVEVSGRDRLSR
jgi:hypothetical protein